MEVSTQKFTWREFEEKVNEWCDCIENKSKDKNKEVYLWFKQCKKYYKIIIVVNKNEKTYAFIDKNTGDIYRPKTKSSPNKDFSKYNIISNHKELLDICDTSGSYL